MFLLLLPLFWGDGWGSGEGKYEEMVGEGESSGLPSGTVLCAAHSKFPLKFNRLFDVSDDRQKLIEAGLWVHAEVCGH